MSDVEELPPSKLGTKEHWDEVYRREVGVFEVCLYVECERLLMGCLRPARLSS